MKPPFLALALAVTACAPTNGLTGVAVNATTVKIVDLGGTVRVPSTLLSAASSTLGFGLLTVGQETPLPDSQVTLSDPTEHFYRNQGHLVSVNTDTSGTYRFQGGVPRKVPVVVGAQLAGDRRLTNFTVPDVTPRTVDLSVASTYATELLRQQSAHDARSMASYDLDKLSAVIDKTRALLQSDTLLVPDLQLDHLAAMNRAYALVVGTGKEIGDAWTSLLGRRLLVMTTAVGTGHASARGDGGRATLAELYRPRQAVMDAAGNLYLVDEGNHKVRRVDAKTELITTVAGTGKPGFGGDNGPATSALLNTPGAIALDAAGNLFIADQANARIRRVAKDGTIATFVGNPAPDGTGGWLSEDGGDGGAASLARIYQPRSLAFDAAGNLYFSDSAPNAPANTVRKVDAATGLIATVVGTPGVGGAFDGDGKSPSAARLNQPSQICFDPQGRLLIADTGNHVVRRVDFKADTIQTVAGIGGQKGSDPDGAAGPRTHLDTPVGVAVNSEGRIFIAEAGKLVTVGLDGLVKTLAGGGSDLEDGDARLTDLPDPQALAIDQTGDVLIPDLHGARLRRLLIHFGV